ncbi:EpsG family protein [Thermotoga sp. Mc24]|uniref:EpsG family protein n=1 Tax=Thermotoga sp. Mc24 TaxID=1231241 RepID=UPI001F38A408|nr:EpsG family protein [Thermotoga sp. Mc24]
MPYLFILVITLAVTVLGRRSRLLIYFYSLLLSIFTGFSGEVSPDRHRYALAHSNQIYVYEPMFNILSKFCHVLSLDERFLFWLFSLLTFTFILLSLETVESVCKTKRFVYVLTFALYIVTPGLYFSQFITIRQSLAISFSVYASILFLTLKGKKRGLSFIFFALAFITHYSSILYFLVFISIVNISKKFFSKRFYLLVFSLITLLGFTPIFKNITEQILLIVLSNIDIYERYAYYVSLSSQFGFKEALSVLAKGGYYLILLLFQIIFPIRIEDESVRKFYNSSFNMFYFGQIFRSIFAFNPSLIRFTNYFVFFGLISFSIWFFERVKSLKSIKVHGFGELEFRYLVYYFLIISIVILYIYNVSIYVGETDTRIFVEHGKKIMELLFGL